MSVYHNELSSVPVRVRHFLQIRHMDPNLYCVLLLAKMKNGKLQVASNYPEVGSQFITSELALRFANCTNEGNVFKDQNAAAAAAAVREFVKRA